MDPGHLRYLALIAAEAFCSSALRRQLNAI